MVLLKGNPLLPTEGGLLFGIYKKVTPLPAGWGCFLLLLKTNPPLLAGGRMTGGGVAF